MPEARFSIGESGALLDIDRVTLQRWMHLEGMSPLSDEKDKRYKYLTREMVLRLAKAHGRNIRDETSIGPRLTGMQRELIGRIQRLEEGQAELLRVIESLDRRTADWRNWRTTLEGAIEARQEAQQAVAASAEVSAYHAPSESPENAPEDVRPFMLTPRVRTLRPAPPGALQKGEWRKLPPVPSGWLTPSQVARELGRPERSFKHALEPRYPGDPERSGDIPYHRGRWRAPHPGTWASELLDPEQQQLSRERFTEQRGE